MEINKNRNAKHLLERLLAVKDSDIRCDILEQGRLAVDKSVHIGGAFSATAPLTTLFFGGFFKADIVDPTKFANDIFVLSKGHAIATMAAIYAEKGYLSKALFSNARSYDSELNAHPGPILPGVTIATGPLGQGISAAVGIAHTQKLDEVGNVYCLVGDGEIQEGIVWEALMYASARSLTNFCLIVDCNCGQNDDNQKLTLPMGDIQRKLGAFDFETISLDGSSYAQLYDAFSYFSERTPQKPLAILSNCYKGQGGFGMLTEGHKVSFTDDFLAQETALQLRRREVRVKNLCSFLNDLLKKEPELLPQLEKAAADCNLDLKKENGRYTDALRTEPICLTKRVPARKKALVYDEGMMPKLEVGKTYKCDAVLSDAIAVLAHDEKMMTIDADMGNITGLDLGMRRTNREKSLNAGIAESNMMGIAEGFAARGYNAWCGTFGMFVDGRVLRRIGVSYQERMESIQSDHGWLSEGHGLDITFLCTAGNLDTQTNGATHMSTDDVNMLMQLPHLKIIDTACPQQLMGVVKWIAQGNRGLVMLRTARMPSVAIYDEEYTFTYGKGYVHGDLRNAQVVIATSARGLYESIDAAKLLDAQGILAAVVDMPSFDEELANEIAAQEDKLLVFAEQNNGFLFDLFLKSAYQKKTNLNMQRLMAINTRDEAGRARFIHSATYEELAGRTGVDAKGIAQRVISKLKEAEKWQ